MENKKVLTMCHDSDTIPMTGKTRPAMNAGKRMEDDTMESTKSYLQTLKAREQEARENAVAGITEKLLAAGLIKPGQKEIGPEKIESAFRAAYMPELLAQEEKNSTGGAGKFTDTGNRCLMRIARWLSMPIYDLRCRPCSVADMFVYTDRQDAQTVSVFPSIRVAEEVKTGAGCLAYAGELAESWGALINAIETERTIVWYPFSVHGWQDGDLNRIDAAPHFFGTYRQLFDILETYNGSIDTWLKVCGQGVNFQNISTSGKKSAFLESVCEQGWDWPTFRDWGRIRTK